MTENPAPEAAPPPTTRTHTFVQLFLNDDARIVARTADVFSDSKRLILHMYDGNNMSFASVILTDGALRQLHRAVDAHVVEVAL